MPSEAVTPGPGQCAVAMAWRARSAITTAPAPSVFIQHVLSSLKSGRRCGIVLDEGVLFRTNETAFVQTKRKLLADCGLWCIATPPGGVFTAAGAGVKTNLLSFTKGHRTERIWYCDLSYIKVGKNTPLTLDKFAEFLPAPAQARRRPPLLDGGHHRPPCRGQEGSRSAPRPARCAPSYCR